jgi:hypothetical protein
MGIFNNNKTEEEKAAEKLAKEEAKAAKQAEKEAAKKAKEAEKAEKIAAKAEAEEARLALYKAINEETLCTIPQAFTAANYHLCPTAIKRIQDGELKEIKIEDIMNYEYIPATLANYLKIPGGFIEPRYKDDERIQIMTKNYQIHTIKIRNDNKKAKIQIIGYLKSHGIESI